MRIAYQHLTRQLMAISACLFVGAAHAGACDDALGFAQTKSDDNPAYDDCESFQIDGTDILAKCPSGGKYSSFTTESCQNIVDGVINGPYVLRWKSGKLESDTYCKNSILKFAKTKSKYNSSPNTCSKYAIAGTNIKGWCDNRKGVEKTSLIACGAVLKEAMSGTTKLQNGNGALVLTNNKL